MGAEMKSKRLHDTCSVPQVYESAAVLAVLSGRTWWCLELNANVSMLPMTMLTQGKPPKSIRFIFWGPDSL